MKLPERFAHLLTGLLAGIALAGGGFAIASTISSHPRVHPTDHVIHGCVNEHTGAVYIRSSCPRGYRAFAWSEEGPRGERGKQGQRGARGAAGNPGTSPWGPATAWNDTATYTPGPPASVVTYEGGTYVATATNSDVVPGTNASDWEEIAAPGGPGTNGTNGTNGTDGTNGMNGTANAWGEIWPTDNSDAGVIAPGSENVVSFNYGGPGDYTVTVSNCNVASPEAASIQVAAGNSAYDPDSPDVTDNVLAEADDGTAVAGHAGELSFGITLYDLDTDTDVNSDFSFTVNC